MNTSDKTNHCPICDEDFIRGHRCPCEVCDGISPVEIISRGVDEYIVFNGQVVLRYGAPVGGSESAWYRLHEDPDLNPELKLRIDIPTHIHVQKALKGEMWPQRPRVFSNNDAVDMYRMLRTAWSS